MTFFIFACLAGVLERNGVRMFPGLALICLAALGGGAPLGTGTVARAAEPPLSAGQLSPLGARQWLNTQALRAEDIRGKVVLVNFWTYSCINSLRALPYVRSWAEKYKDRGLVVVGVHTGVRL